MSKPVIRALLLRLAIGALSLSPHQGLAASVPDATLKVRLATPNFDYFRERERIGLAAFERERDAIGEVIARRHDAKSIDDICVTEQEHTVLDGYYSAARAKSATEWTADTKAAFEQHRVAVARIEHIMAGEDTRNPREQAAASMVRVALEEADPKLKALYLRGAHDQLVRAMLYQHIDMGQIDPSLSQNATLSFLTHIANYGCNVDRANREWLAAEIKSHGWFDIKRYGARADAVAWLLVQHADQDVAFQAETLKALERSAQAGETNPRSYAYLYDRVAINQSRPQKFGTQGRCIAPGNWQMDEVENSAELESLRQRAGLGPQATYAKSASDQCG